MHACRRNVVTLFPRNLPPPRSFFSLGKSCPNLLLKLQRYTDFSDNTHTYKILIAERIHVHMYRLICPTLSSSDTSEAPAHRARLSTPGPSLAQHMHVHKNHPAGVAARMSHESGETQP